MPVPWGPLGCYRWKLAAKRPSSRQRVAGRDGARSGASRLRRISRVRPSIGFSAGV
jgi:hypothetical protein